MLSPVLDPFSLSSFLDANQIFILCKNKVRPRQQAEQNSKKEVSRQAI